MKTLKQWLAALLVASTACGAVAADVSFSIAVGDPNFYGRVGNVEQRYPPAVIYEQPVVVRQSEYIYPPLYLRVPPKHAQQWRRHCSAYGACGRPVYFVKDSWYREAYRQRYYRQDGHRGRGHGSNKHWKHRGDD